MFGSFFKKKGVAEIDYILKYTTRKIKKVKGREIFSCCSLCFKKNYTIMPLHTDIENVY